MKNKARFLSVLFFSIIICNFSKAQIGDPALRGWHLKDKADDNVYGVSLKKAYDFLKKNNYEANPVIVAVIDNGIDTAHEDLKNVLWKNSREIPGNGIDDDGNGYIDDVYGWNFLGNKEGKSVTKESHENERVYYRYKEKWERFDSTQTNTLSAGERKEYATWKKAAVANKLPVYVNSSSVNVMQKLYAASDDPNKRRKEIVGDNLEDINDRYYGNSNVMAGNMMHGTHVAGTIAAQRDNQLGMDGVADHARIMAVRAVPDGAGCIRYRCPDPGIFPPLVSEPGEVRH